MGYFTHPYQIVIEQLINERVRDAESRARARTYRAERRALRPRRAASKDGVG